METRPKSSESFLTYDMSLAAVLVLLKYDLVYIDKENPKKVAFVFARQKDIDQDVDKFWNDNIKVKARSYFDTLKMLKNRIYSD